VTLPDLASSGTGIVRVHASETEYHRWVKAHVPHPAAQWERMRAYRRFVERWPDLESFFAEPLVVRLGFVDPKLNSAGRGAAHEASGYLVYLSLRHGISLDYDFLLGRKYARIFATPAGGTGLGVDLELFRRHIDRLVELGYPRPGASSALTWGFGRMLLHRGDPDLNAVTAEDLYQLGAAIRTFGERPDVEDLRRFLYSKRAESIDANTGLRFVRNQLSLLHIVHVLLYNIGQVSETPTAGTKVIAGWQDRLLPEPCPPEIRHVIERYLTVRLEAKLDRPQTVRLAREGLRRFVNWLAADHGEINNLAQLDRYVVEEYLRWLPGCVSRRTGGPLCATTVKHEINAIAAFCRDTAIWGWDDVPGRPLLTARDSPRRPQSIPRYLPRHELDALMSAIENLTDPHQRAALLLIRWTGARRDEIRRLTVDCLDAYPDGHPRLRIPVGKSHAERLIPLHPQAAEALQPVIDLARNCKAIARHDPVVGRHVDYVFVRHGKLLSAQVLFGAALHEACTAAGLVDAHGVATVSAHRFRHTVGTHLAEGGARIQTIMAILGHQSPAMALIYARLSDPEVRRQYEEALTRGTGIAGPAAEALLTGSLDADAVHWLQTNFLKTELELGHCLRLPAEGPCECDLVLTCPKFVTTSDYAPRIRQRLDTEDELIADAERRGWVREVERHRSTKRRLQQLLAELGEQSRDKQTGTCQWEHTA
jgi:integrase